MQYGRSLSIPYGAWLTGYSRQSSSDLTQIFWLYLKPFVWRKSLYVITYNFFIYRLADNGELVQE